MISRTRMPDTGNADKVIAYRFVKLPDGTAVIDSFIVDEAYVMEHPVWVINQNDIDYEDLPDFVKKNQYKINISPFLLRSYSVLTPFFLRSFSVHSSFILRSFSVQERRRNEE